MVAFAEESKTKTLHTLNLEDVMAILKASGYSYEEDDGEAYTNCEFFGYNQYGQAVYSVTFKNDEGEPELGKIFVWAEWDSEGKGVIKADY